MGHLESVRHGMSLRLQQLAVAELLAYGGQRVRLFLRLLLHPEPVCKLAVGAALVDEALGHGLVC